MEIAVEDSKSEYENIMNPIRSFEKQLKDYHTKLAEKQQPEFIGFLKESQYITNIL